MSEAYSPETEAGVHADLSLKMWEGWRCERVHYSITLASLFLPSRKRECVREGGRERERKMPFKVPLLLLLHVLTFLTEMFHLH